MKRITALMLSLLLSTDNDYREEHGLHKLPHNKRSNQRRFDNDLLLGRLTRSLW